MRLVRDLVDLFGPDIGVPTLRDHCPSVPRRLLEETLHRVRADWHKKSPAKRLRCLRWNSPGSIWAIDYTDAPGPIDGVYPYACVVRDITTGFIITARPVVHADSDTTIAVLQDCFQRHEPPLVLKSDNGSHFTEFRVRLLLHHHRVSLLLSPPRTPRYNGACEAGIGAIKSRCEHLAQADGNGPAWTSNHLEAARLWSNSRPSSPTGLTPQQLFAARRPICPDQRSRFLRAVDQAKARLSLTIQQPITADALTRIATAETLTSLGYLTIRSRPVPQPISEQKVQEIP